MSLIVNYRSHTYLLINILCVINFIFLPTKTLTEDEDSPYEKLQPITTKCHYCQSSMHIITIRIVNGMI